MPGLSLSLGLGLNRVGGGGDPFAAYVANEVPSARVLDFKSGIYQGADGERISDPLDLVTFSRTSTATYWSSAGVLTTAASGELRDAEYAYVGGQWVKQGARIESSAKTNLLTYSENFAAGIWNASNVTVARDVTGPDNVTNSGTTATITDPSCRLRNTGVTVTAETAYTFSFKAKKGTSNTLNYAIFDVSNGAWIVASANYAGQLSADRYTTVNVQFTTPAGCTNIYVYLINSGSATGTVFLYGAELKTGAPSSYIATNGATATRAAEVLTIAAAKKPVVKGVHMRGTMNYLDTGVSLSSGGGGGAVLFYLDKAGTSDFIHAGLDTQSTRTGQFVVAQRDGASGFDQATGGVDDFAPGVAVPFSIATRHDDTVVGGGFDGSAITPDTTPTVLPDLSAQSFQIAQNFNGVLERVVLYAADIGDAGVEAITA